jgi:hypothetical protein
MWKCTVTDTEEKDSVKFMELYYKGDKENEDSERILKYYRD